MISMNATSNQSRNSIDSLLRNTSCTLLASFKLCSMNLIRIIKHLCFGGMESNVCELMEKHCGKLPVIESNNLLVEAVFIDLNVILFNIYEPGLAELLKRSLIKLSINLVKLRECWIYTHTKKFIFTINDCNVEFLFETECFGNILCIYA